LRVFVCEFVTGGGLAGRPLPPGLCREGDMMLQALVKDLAELPGLEVAVTRDRRLPAPGLPCAMSWVDAGDDPWALWHAAITDADAVWPIAPETDGLLARLSDLVVASDRSLLGCRPDAVRLTASKRRTAEHLAAQGVAVVPTFPLTAALAGGLPAADAAGSTGWVVKPDDGAGAEDTLLFRSAAALGSWVEATPDLGRFVVQPYLPGRATSLSLLCSKGEAALLSCNVQDVRLEDDRFRYCGGIVGGAEDSRAAYLPVAAAVAAAIPGLWGYVGVDLVETASGPVVLEINPRLTTSYAGLRQALGGNPAALVMALLGRDVAAVTVPRKPGVCTVTVDDHAA
jgi:predicted ATP-grasp superfamily ATP-dependent carboligase